MLKSSAAPKPVDLLDPAQADTAAFRAWRQDAEMTCSQQRTVCDAIRAIGEAADNLHVSHGVSAVQVEPGLYTIEHPARSGNPPMTVTLRVPSLAPDAGAGEEKKQR
jgi:hypothetical protein